jgi:maltooligosyltrehalose synthase
VWGDTIVAAERGLPGGPYRDVLTGRRLTPQREGRQVGFALADLFAHLPVALLERVA